MKVTRRKALKAHGAVLTLPLFHSLARAADAKATAKPSQKLAIIYIPNGIVRRCFFPGEENADLPGFIGGFEADKTKNERRFKHKPGVYLLELTQTMKPLAEHAGDITLITSCCGASTISSRWRTAWRSALLIARRTLGNRSTMRWRCQTAQFRIGEIQTAMDLMS